MLLATKLVLLLKILIKQKVHLNDMIYYLFTDVYM